MERESLGLAMAAAQKGDTAAYRELLQAVTAILRAYLKRMVFRMGIAESGIEEDLVQETLIAVHEKRHTYDPAQPFLPWLFAIARYKAIDYGRRRKRAPVPLDFEVPVFSEPGAVSDLKKLLDQLPETSRRAIELVKLEGLSVAEAAAASRMSESALKVTIHRALKKLRGGKR